MSSLDMQAVMHISSMNDFCLPSMMHGTSLARQNWRPMLYFVRVDDLTVGTDEESER